MLLDFRRRQLIPRWLGFGSVGAGSGSAVPRSGACVASKTTGEPVLHHKVAAKSTAITIGEFLEASGVTGGGRHTGARELPMAGGIPSLVALCGRLPHPQEAQVSMG